MQNILLIGKKLGLSEDEIECYGKYMAKIEGKNYDKKGKLILVSAMNPTTAGEGKTTVSIGLSDALNRLGKKAVLSLREPSLGPVFGMKGGATGGGKAIIEPSDEINLHFTGDLHAITSANNLLCAMLDNSIFQGNPLKIDPNEVYFNRAMDMNDRALRDITISQGSPKVSPRKDSFVITAASEIMAILCLATDLENLKERLGNILVALSTEGKPIYARDLGAVEAMTSLLTHAIKPNLVQTGDGNPAIVHGGPFANIAHGCSSIIATRTALSMGEYCITEGGFGGDLGGEKFMDIVCRQNGLNPSMVVLVATIKAIKLHSANGSLEEGFKNLQKHIQNFKNVFNQKTVVALNKYADDNESDIDLVKKLCENEGVVCISCDQFAKGGEGCLELGEYVINNCEERVPQFPYELSDSLEDKIFKLANKIYGATAVEYTPEAIEKMAALEPLIQNMPIVVAKTQYSLSDDATLVGRPENFTLHVKNIELKNGCGFVVIKTGDIFLMPGLGKKPNALRITVDKDGTIHNLK